MWNSRLLLILMSSVLALGSSAQAGELAIGIADSPKMEQELRQDPGTPGNFPRIEALTVGRPAAICTLSSWITSNQMAHDYETDSIWLDNEQIKIMALLFTPRSGLVKAIIRVYDDKKNLVTKGNAEFAPTPSSVMFVSSAIGYLNPGFYKVKVTLKQGKKTVGMQYWFAVNPAP